ncbi:MULTISPECIES: DUF4912 domain-containing protein [unclassified Mesotoga]|uniref:DUF4912 domain-containing protein n=1 Tax=unclassified Mesotoga TaxID=1184398 RepID=UPI000DC0219F|nr:MULTISPECIES: DUF4912 domain-containing protein [unclassified Mesotoga]MDD3459773.1 DUF4912 domain-containing protein [Mesotoga sp.]RAM59851.1 hypothetical protein DS66_03070 [Mesotoga sp. SC_3PWM13N19]
MINEEIQSFLSSDPTIQDLRRFAKMMGINLKRTMGKKDISRALKKHAQESKHVSSDAATKTPSEILRPSKPVNAEIPSSYFHDFVTIHPVNPYWVYVEWDLSERTARDLSTSQFRLLVRVSDITNIIYDGKNAHRFKESDISIDAGNWYFQVDFPDADYIAEIGYYSDGHFKSVLKSGITRTPRNSPKFTDNEIWVDLRKGSRKELKVSHESSRRARITKSSGPTGNPSSEEFIKTISKSRSGR